MPIAVTSSGRPTCLPITLTEAKAHLKVDHSDEDAYIAALIKAVTTRVEAYTGRSLINTQYQWKLDCFPGGCEMKLPKPPLVSIDSITYLASSDGASTDWGSTYYSADTVSQPGRLYPAYEETWPTNVRAIQNAVTIKFTAGYGTASTNVPADLRHGMLMSIGHIYENRQDVVVGTGFMVEIPKASEFFIDPYRVYFFEGY